MRAYSKSLLAELDRQLAFVHRIDRDPLVYSERALQILIPTFADMKIYINEHPFISKDDEIYFFKKIKPSVLGKIIYYNELYSFYSEIPSGGRKVTRKYYKSALLRITKFQSNNAPFVRYCRTGATYLDHLYYIRGVFDVSFSLENTYFNSDATFATPCDYKLAQLNANDLLKSFFEKELVALHKDEFGEKPSSKILQWTAPKVAFIELLYALHSEGVFCNGSCELKEIAVFFEQCFGVELGQFHRTFIEIRGRKTERTRFLKRLSEVLERRMEDADER